MAKLRASPNLFYLDQTLICFKLTNLFEFTNLVYKLIFFEESFNYLGRVDLAFVQFDLKASPYYVWIFPTTTKFALYLEIAIFSVHFHPFSYGQETFSQLKAFPK